MRVRLTGRIVSEHDIEVLEAIVENPTRSRRSEYDTRAADRLRAVGELAGGIAHEFHLIIAEVSNRLKSL